MRTIDRPTLVKRRAFSTHRVVEEAIDLSKTDQSCSWGELLPKDDVNALYPLGICCEQSPEDRPGK